MEVETPTASPFASSLLFDYVATYMYEGDTPNAERRAAALSLDRELLRELLGQEELRELIDPEALAEVEDSLQHRAELARAKDRDALQQILRRLGDLTPAECQQRVAEGYSADSMLEKLERERRAARVRVAGEERWIASEDAALYRDALGVPPPAGLPETFLAELPDAMVALVRRYARTHGPFPTAQLARRYGTDPSAALRELERAGELVRGELLPGGSEREWCDPEVLRRLRRASLAHLRAEAEAVDPRELARFLPSWQNVDARRAAGAGPDRLREGLVPLQGVALTPEVWERDVLPRRLGAYSPAWLDELCTGGELVWIGAGALGRSGGKVALYFREDVRLAGPPPANLKLEPPAGDAQDAIRDLLGRRPCFWLDLVSELDLPAEELHTALWDLVWGGEVTNDAFAPLRAPRLRSLQRERAAPRQALRGPPRRRRPGRAGPLVADRAAVPKRPLRGPAAAGPGRVDAGALRDRDPGDRAGRGRPGWLREPLRRDVQPGDAGHRPPRLLRGGPRRSAVRAPGSGRAASLPAQPRRALPGAGGHRPGESLWRRRAVAEARRRRGRPAAQPYARGLRAAPRRRAALVRRARRPRDPAAS